MSPKLRLGLANDRRRSTPAATPLPTRGHIVVSVGGAEFALDARRVRHLLPATASDLAHGGVRFLGRTYPIRDLRRLLGASGPASARRFFLVTEGERQHVAFVVDGITALVRVDDAAVLPLPNAFGARERRRFAGLLRRQDHVVPLLDVDGVVE